MQRRGIGGFPCYPVQAKTRTEVIEAMQKKKSELNLEIGFYDTGLRKIQGLVERGFYEVSYREGNYLAQCWKFGRDHVEFRIFTCTYDSDKFRAGKMSLMWNWEWETTPVDLKNAALYVAHQCKNENFEKLLKGKYRSLPKGE